MNISKRLVDLALPVPRKLDIHMVGVNSKLI